MQNPFGVLGLSIDASAQQVRAAYHTRVKLCHPDMVQDVQAQQTAQEQLVQLNLAYAEALRQASYRETHNVVVPDARHVAQKLYEAGQYEGALRILNKAPERDAAWFALQGNILLKRNVPEAAHAAFRTAIRIEPENIAYREMALKAGVEMRRQKTVRGRMQGWARGLVDRML